MGPGELLMGQLASSATRWTEMGLVPDAVIRAGIRRLLLRRLTEINASNSEAAMADLNRFVSEMDQSVVAPVPELANEQHYEVPAEFFDLVLGQRRKYSACLWRNGTDHLDRAEEDALKVTCERAGLSDNTSLDSVIATRMNCLIQYAA